MQKCVSSCHLCTRPQPPADSENVLFLCFVFVFSLKHIFQQKYFDEEKEIVLSPKTYKVKGKSCFLNLWSLLYMDGASLTFTGHIEGLVSRPPDRGHAQVSLFLRDLDQAWGHMWGVLAELAPGLVLPSWPKDPTYLSDVPLGRCAQLQEACGILCSTGSTWFPSWEPLGPRSSGISPSRPPSLFVPQAAPCCQTL